MCGFISCVLMYFGCGDSLKYMYDLSFSDSIIIKLDLIRLFISFAVMHMHDCMWLSIYADTTIILFNKLSCVVIDSV